MTEPEEPVYSSTRPRESASSETETNPDYSVSAGDIIYLPIGNPELYNWSSSDDSVAAVIWDGIAAAGRAGTAVIKAENGSSSYSFTVTVGGIDWEHLGDINMNGAVDSHDAILALNEYVLSVTGGSDAEPMNSRQILAADINQDGVIGLADAQFILQFYTEKVVAESSLSAEECWKKILGQ
ncbi:MAG TPA: hypothetical protein DCP68_06990 [Ruminococcus sp.]|nr:hypothetical protein [Ruminococcus sp.]